MTSHPTEDCDPGLMFSDHQVNNIREPRMEQEACPQHQVSLKNQQGQCEGIPKNKCPGGALLPYKL